MAKTLTIDSFGLEVEGLKEFSKALKGMSEQFPKAMTKANFQVADTIVKAAQSKAASEPGVASKAARSLRAGRAAGYASIRGGGAKFPYFYGAEFGAKRYRQFQAWRGNQWGGWSGGPGYFLHPAIREAAPKAMENYMRKIEALGAVAFPD